MVRIEIGKTDIKKKKSKYEKMKIIGLTGGIGSGKSTASAYLKQKGCLLIDADKISGRLTEKGSPYLEILRETFGEEFFLADGQLDRKKLGRYVFSKPEQKEKLEKIITNAVIKITLDRIEELKQADFKGIVILDAPLLFECGMQKYTDESWLVKAEPCLVTERVKKRDGLSSEEVRERIAVQMPLCEKEAIADRMIDNSRDLGYLYKQLDREIDRLKNGEETNVKIR